MNSNASLFRELSTPANGQYSWWWLKPITLLVSMLLLSGMLSPMFSGFAGVTGADSDSSLSDPSGSSGVPDSLKALVAVGSTTILSGCTDNPMDKLTTEAQEAAGAENPDPYGTKGLDKIAGTKDEDMQAEPSDDEVISYPVVVTPIGQLGVGYDDGLMDHDSSMSPSGHAVFFSNENISKIKSIQFYGCRYDEIDQGMTVEIWDKDMKTLYSANYDYEDYFTYSYPRDSEAKFDWIDIAIPNIQANEGFYVVLFTNSFKPLWVTSDDEAISSEDSSAEETYVEESSNDEETSQRGPPEGFRPKDGIPEGGIMVGVDTSSNSGNSYVANQNPNSLSKYKANWMIRVIYV